MPGDEANQQEDFVNHDGQRQQVNITNAIRTTIVSSDSLIESNQQRGRPDPKTMVNHMMTRMIWINYLKILYD